MKKGFLGTEIADFIAILTFIVFVVVMLILFKLKGAGASAEVTASFEGASTMTDLLNILHTTIPDKNLTIEKLIMNSNENALISNLSYLYETLNLTNPEMTAFDSDGRQIFSIRRGFYSWHGSGSLSNYEWKICTPDSAEVILPYHNSYIEVIFKECLK